MTNNPTYRKHLHRQVGLGGYEVAKLRDALRTHRSGAFEIVAYQPDPVDCPHDYRARFALYFNDPDQKHWFGAWLTVQATSMEMAIIKTRALFKAVATSDAIHYL